MNARAIAARIINQVCHQGRSLSQAMEKVPPASVDDRPLIQEMCYGTVRDYFRLEDIAKGLLKKPLKAKDGDVHALLLVGLYQLLSMRVPHHAVVSETVAGTTALKKPWARGLVNAVLRRFLREQLNSQDGQIEQAQQNEQVVQNEQVQWAHPQWLIDEIRSAWPNDWQTILEANNKKPPMTLRVNQSQVSEADYLKELQAENINATILKHCPGGIQLDPPVDVAMLPGFASGRVSVQDSAAQWAATLLQLEPGQRVLDVCAAPGGKTGHILETCQVDVVAVDIDAQRLQRVEENLKRLNKSANLVVGDASDISAWWDGVEFDRILLDAPCSATGVIRRHPDIKLLRRADDIPTLVSLQAKIMNAVWSMLKPGGILVYATCSVLPQENAEQVTAFIGQHEDARHRHIDAEWGRKVDFGYQILPGVAITDSEAGGMDGFYYACIEKSV